MQIWYFRNSVSWEWAERDEGREGRPESGEQMLSIVGVTVRPLLVGTQYKILCVKMMLLLLLLLLLLFFLFCACCIIFQIVLQLKWFEPPLNSCQSCHRKQFTIPKGPSHNQMGPYTRNLSNCPALLWFLIWQSIDSSFGKHKQTLAQKTVQKVSNNLAKTMCKAYFPFPIHSRSHNHSHNHNHIHIPLNLSTSSISAFQCEINSTINWMRLIAKPKTKAIQPFAMRPLTMIQTSTYSWVLM